MALTQNEKKNYTAKILSTGYFIVCKFFAMSIKQQESNIFFIFRAAKILKCY